MLGSYMVGASPPIHNIVFFWLHARILKQSQASIIKNKLEHTYYVSAVTTVLLQYPIGSFVILEPEDQGVC